MQRFVQSLSSLKNLYYHVYLWNGILNSCEILRYGRSVMKARFYLVLTKFSLGDVQPLLIILKYRSSVAFDSLIKIKSEWNNSRLFDEK